MIFGFVRHKQVKVFRSFAGDKDTPKGPDAKEQLMYRDEDDANNSDNSGSTDNRTDNSDNNSFFDPPLENYNFFYKDRMGGINEST